MNKIIPLAAAALALGVSGAFAQDGVIDTGATPQVTLSPPPVPGAFPAQLMAIGPVAGVVAGIATIVVVGGLGSTTSTVSTTN